MKLLDHYNIAIIGGGILGTSIAYFLSSASTSRVLLIEQEHDVAFHTSTRNTGKVHAPFLYDPIKKRLFAKAAFLGFDMLKEYCTLKSLPFKQDGVLEVATHDNGIDILQKYIEWGYSNGLQRSELKFLQKEEIIKIEPNVKCLSAIYCLKDGSVIYGAITKQLFEDAKQFGCTIITGSKVRKILCRNNYMVLYTHNGEEISADYVINAAGGNAVDIAHSMGVANEYTDLHFRGEYWQAPPEYNDLTKLSIYSVPKYPEYPFLDPHWIVRIDGRREVGPNAVPVFGPYAYGWSNNLRYFIPKVFESSRTGVRKILINRQFLSLASNELKSSLSKHAMINRAREFLPQLKPSLFTQRGTSGIRSSLLDKYGKFVSDTLIIKKDRSLHLLNYNSPGATGALPMAALVVNQLIEDGFVSNVCNKNNNSEIKNTTTSKKAIWDIRTIADQMKM
ncbi:MAG TPA: FAD-dependent oxidoreductase [Nitrososphaeraceae archaeon]|nr:FAD-dependent oxidoreductase [Nitrososphaeraceae archaeon]